MSLERLICLLIGHHWQRLESPRMYCRRCGERRVTVLSPVDRSARR